MKVFPLFIYSAISMAVYTAVFIPLMVGSIKDGTPTEKLHKATLASIGLGFGEAIGGIMHG